MNDVSLILISLKFIHVVLIKPGVDTVDSELKHALKSILSLSLCSWIGTEVFCIMLLKGTGFYLDLLGKKLGGKA